jgi:hypothetical protein
MRRPLLAGVLVVSGLLFACEAPPPPVRAPASRDLNEPPPAREAPVPSVEQSLARLLRDSPADGRVEVQLEARPSGTLASVTDDRLAALDARVVTRSRPIVTVTAPAGVVPALASLEEVGWVRLPARPIADLGPSTSEGVETTGAERMHCLGIDGAGVDVAIVDTFGDYDRSRQAGELATVVAPPRPASDPHGTQCAEIVSDMAPGVSLHLEHSEGIADLLAFVESLEQRHIDVMSHSVSYFGYGFGDGTGVLCDAAAAAARAGTAWVNSAGNDGSWNVYRSDFKDDDGDGWHEFERFVEVTDFMFSEDMVAGVPVWVRLDWNAYPTTDIDLDLYVRRWDGSGWVDLASSTNVQAGAEPPFEAVQWTSDGGGPAAVAVLRRDEGTAPIDLRIVADLAIMDGSPEGSIGDPASCPDVLAVGASWEDAAQDYSARGPTFDGRVKPDLVAPTRVTTSAGSFGGTSAAAPHVAGAIALTMQGRGVTAPEAAALLLAEAADAQHPVPSNETGWGRLALAPEAAGWQCVASESQSCVTACGSAGTQPCTAFCGWGDCTPPVEACNAADDDCDGAIDEDFLCLRGTTQACTTPCGTAGVSTCDGSCLWGACLTAEECNGQDDDCDGETDEDAGCPERVTYSTCATAPRGAGARADAWALVAGLLLARSIRRAPRRG